MLSTKRQSDARAVRRALRGDGRAFETLVRQYHGAVHGLCYAHLRNHADAEDMTQEAFIRAYTRLNSLADPGSFAPWLLTTARNLCLNHYAKQRTASAALKAAEHHAASTAEATESPMDDTPLHDLLREHLDQLPDDHREVLTLHYFAGKDTAEIARLLEISREAAKKRLQRSRELLGKHMEGALREEAQAGRITEEQLVSLIRTVVAAPAPWLGKEGMAAAGWFPGGTVTVLWKAAAVAVVVLGAGSYMLYKEYLNAANAASSTASSSSLRGATSSITDTSVRAASAAAVAGDTTRFAVHAVSEQTETTTVLEPSLEPVSHMAQAHAPDLTGPKKNDDAETENLYLAPDPSPEELTGTGVVSGIIMRSDGSGVPDATVQLTPLIWDNAFLPDTSKISRTYITDRDGAFMATELPLIPIKAIVNSEHGGARVTIKLAPGNEFVLVKLEVTQMSLISGTVLDAKREPISNAIVMQHYNGDNGTYAGRDWATLYAQVTDADGAFTIGPFETGSEWSLIAWAPGFAWTESTRFDPGSKEPVAIQLQEGCEIHGTVLESETNAPVTGMHIRLFASQSRADTSLTTSDEAGHFTAGGLTPGGTYNVVADTNLPWIQAEPVQVVASTESRREATVRIQKGASISGRITSSITKRPIPGLQIQSTFGLATETDSNGEYVLVGFPTHQSFQLTYSITELGIYRTRMHESELTIETKDGLTGVDFEVPIPDLQPVRGLVTDGGTATVSGAKIYTAFDPQFTISGNDNFIRHELTSKTDGSFEFYVPTEYVGTVSIQAVWNQYVGPISKAPIPAANGEVPVLIVSVPDPKSFVAGIVVDENGNALRDVGVSVADLSGQVAPIPRGGSGYDGRFELYLPAGTYSLALGRGFRTYGSHYRDEPNVATVTLEPGQMLENVQLVFVDPLGEQDMAPPVFSSSSGVRQ